jgi:hypothetical protein
MELVKLAPWYTVFLDHLIFHQLRIFLLLLETLLWDTYFFSFFFLTHCGTKHKILGVIKYFLTWFYFYITLTFHHCCPHFKVLCLGLDITNPMITPLFEAFHEVKCLNSASVPRCSWMMVIPLNLQHRFEFWDTKNSLGAKSGGYGECWMTVILFSRRNSHTPKQSEQVHCCAGENIPLNCTFQLYVLHIFLQTPKGGNVIMLVYSGCLWKNQ